MGRCRYGGADPHFLKDDMSASTPGGTSEAALLQLVAKLNADPDVDGTG